MIEFFILALVKSIAYLLHKFVIEVEIMKYGKAHSESLTRFEEVSYV